LQTAPHSLVRVEACEEVGRRNDRRPGLGQACEVAVTRDEVVGLRAARERQEVCVIGIAQAVVQVRSDWDGLANATNELWQRAGKPDIYREWRRALSPVP